MAEDDAKSAKAKFKSKWHRVFKEKEEHELTPHHTNSFKLQDDVADFLKPSTDNAGAGGTRTDLLVPKLDVSIAQRWPSANEVRTASSGPFTPNGFTKPKRRKGLSVGFVRAEPEIIGEGGDESGEPVAEVGRRKALMAVTAAERRPRAVTHGAQLSGGQNVLPLQATQAPLVDSQISPESATESSSDMSSLRRVNTAPGDYSPPMTRKELTPTVDEKPPQLPRLSRTPTGASSDSEFGFGSFRLDKDDPPVPRIDTTFADQQANISPPAIGMQSNIPSASPRDPSSLAARKRELASGEGMILRRASAMIKDREENDEQKRESLALGVQLPAQHYDTLSRPDAPSLMPEVPTPRSALTPKSASSPSPFADPKYLKRHSREPSVEEHRPSLPQISPRRESRDHAAPLSAIEPASPLSQATAGWAPVPLAQPLHTADENVRPAQTTEQPKPARLQRKPAMQIPPPQPPPISTAPPPEITYHRPSRGEDQLIGMRVPSSSAENSPHRPSPSSTSRHSPSAPLQYSNPQQDSPRSRDPSPRQARPYEDNAELDKPRTFYSDPNGSRTSLTYAPPVAGHTHSRDSSRDSNSPGSQQPAGSAVPRSSAARSSWYNQSPQSGSPRNSMYGRPSASGSGTNLSPVDYITTSRPTQSSHARSPLQHVHQDGASSRPSSTGSNSAAHQPAPGANFSVPRMPYAEQSGRLARWSAVYLQQADHTRSSSADSRHSRERTPDRVPVLKTPQAPNDSTGRPQAAPRSVSTGTAASARPSILAQNSSEGNPAADAALADFAARVAHMKGVFRLTAEKERPMDRCPPLAWLRAALWWYLSGKSGLEVLLRQRSRSPDGQYRELLTQPHVDLAKTWWILADPLGVFDVPDRQTPDSAVPGSAHPDAIIRQSVAVLKSYMKSLLLSMSRSQLMPPPQSLIQGQDTVIWLDYPRLHADAVGLLGGRNGNIQMQEVDLLPLDALPLGDDRETFCYGRFPVDLTIKSDDPSVDRMVVPCILSMLRGKQDFGTTIVIASQNELVNIKVVPLKGQSENLTWYDVSWKNNPPGMGIQLHRNFEVRVGMQEKDFRTLWNLLKYAEKIEDNIRPDKDERLLHEAQLAELQYADSTNAKAFPPDKIRGARALVFERIAHAADASGDRKIHRGYRLALVVDPKNKSLACVSHEIGRRGPLYFEFITDAAANGMVAMVIRIREDTRQCRILMVLPDVEARQDLFDELNGVMVGPDEMIVGKMALAGMNIEPALQARSLMQEVHPALRALQWQRLGVTNKLPQDPNGRLPSTIHSDSLRVVARHTTGCITDRMNLGKGELLLRLPCADVPAMQIFRHPQEDIGISIDTRSSEPSTADGVTQLEQTARQQTTIRTYSFTSYDDLHAFQTAITGCTVRYDGLASTFSISRRRMVVPIYKKWEAVKVRLQIVSYDTVVQVLAFMEDFSHTNAMCFQVKSTDTFENAKGDSKGKKWTVKMVDAKFSLPHIPENHNEEGAAAEDAMARVKRRFVNLEGLEYAEEHDDVVVGFETQEDRDRFAQALPAPATGGRGITLKRRT